MTDRQPTEDPTATTTGPAPRTPTQPRGTPPDEQAPPAAEAPPEPPREPEPHQSSTPDNTPPLPSTTPRTSPPPARAASSDRPSAAPAEAEASFGDAAATAGTESASAPGGADGPLVAAAERERLTAELHRVVAHFVEEPRGSVEEADALLGTLVERLTESAAERRTALRTHWDDEEQGTEELRRTLQQYRQLTERLLHT